MAKTINLSTLNDATMIMINAFSTAYMEKARISKEHREIISALETALEKAKEARSNGEADSIITELNAINAENLRYKELCKPLNTKLSALKKTVPDTIYDSYVKMISENKFGYFMNDCKKFFADSGVDTKNSTAMKNFAQAMMCRIGARKSSYDDISKLNSFTKERGKGDFKMLFLLSFIDVLTQQGLVSKDCYKPTTNTTDTVTTDTSDTSTVTADKYTVKQLKDLLKSANATISGNKTTLFNRAMSLDLLTNTNTTTVDTAVTDTSAN